MDESTKATARALASPTLERETLSFLDFPSSTAPKSSSAGSGSMSGSGTWTRTGSKMKSCDPTLRLAGTSTMGIEKSLPNTVKKKDGIRWMVPT